MKEREKEKEGEGLIFKRAGFTPLSLSLSRSKWQYKEVCLGCGWIYYYYLLSVCLGWLAENESSGTHTKPDP